MRVVRTDRAAQFSGACRIIRCQGAAKCKGATKLFWIAVTAAAILRPQLVAAAPVKEVRRVLIFYELGLSSPAVTLLDREILTALEASPFQIELYREYLETTLFPDPAAQQEFRRWYIHKYRDRKPDLIIALGPSPLKFIVDAHERAFRDIPVVFGGTSEEQADHPMLDNHFTGVWERFEPSKTLEVALRLQPETKHVIVVGGTSSYDRHLEAIYKKDLHSYEDHFDISYLTDLDMPVLLNRLKHVPQNSVILYANFEQDAAGTPFVAASQADPMFASVANAPIFSSTDVDWGHGEVGGDVESFAEEGKTIGKITQAILNGKRPQDIPIVNGANVYLFDWRALRRWGFSEGGLPPGSLVLYRQPTAWESYKWYVISGISLILAEALLIFGLVWQRARRRKVESELAMTYDRLRLAVDAGRSVGWDWDVKSGRDQWFGDLRTMFGIPADSYSGHVSEFRRRVHPEDRELVWKALESARESRNPYVAEFRVLRNDGAVRWITARGRFYYANNGDAERMLGMAVDISDHKAAEEELASLSGRLIDAQEEERKRIAREIHDDYNQRLAVLAIDLEELAGNLENSSEEAGQRLHQLCNRIGELAEDLHSLSHRLHSSTLESLGLVAGTKALCQEFADQQGVQVDFVHENVPRGIPGDVALCLFRIAQEALRNVKRHSSADRAEVRLEAVDGKLHLSVADRGRGFDANRRSMREGIGIQSMKERLRALGGQLEIDSRPMEGTRIDAWLPFRASSQRAG